MPAKHSLHVALTQPIVRHVREQVAKGRYSNASEAVREALQLLIDRDSARDNRSSGGQQAPRHG